MPERQVYAIYMSFKKSGKFKTNKVLMDLKTDKPEKKAEKSDEKWHQMTFSEVFEAGNIKNNVIMEVK